MSFRPDLVSCWTFRVDADGQLRILLLHRSPGRIFPGIWQPVTGKLEAVERIVDGALLELVEETGIGPGAISTLYGLDLVNSFHAEHADEIQTEAVFAVDVEPGIEAVLSEEHDDQRWVTPAEAAEMVPWPSYREAIRQIEWIVSHRDMATLWQAGAWAVDGSRPPAT
jgi:8-oxo-dGTP pyrophosphatase MutT (NUDIX family)